MPRAIMPPRSRMEFGLQIAAFLALTAISAPRVQSQTLGGGAGNSPGSAETEPRGSAVTRGASDAGSPGSNDFGGLSGGRGRSGGSFGSQSLNVLGDSPGDPGGSRLGDPLGASGAVALESSPDAQGPVLGGRMGAGSSRVPVGNFQPGGGTASQQRMRERQRMERTRREVKPLEVDPISLSSSSRLELPRTPEAAGPGGGLTLDDAIGLLLRQNLDLIAMRHEIPKADADILTAGLRSNPILYADGQLITYGRPTRDRPAGGNGQPQYDVNITQPIDISRKRRARIEVACQAKRVIEAQFQDAVRNLIDELYVAYANVLAARETLRYSEAYLQGMTKLLETAQRHEQQLRAKGGGDNKGQNEKVETAADAVADLRDQVQQGKFQTRRAQLALARSRRELALLLNIPEDRAEALQVRGRLRELNPLPAPAETLIRRGLEIRPDLVAYRLGVQRAKADVRLAKANRFSDIYVVYQPYTFQDNALYGYKSSHSWALGVNAALPIYNRNQGNIARAEINSRQTDIELSSMERRVAHEVSEAIRSFEFTQADVLELEQEVLPGSLRARDIAFKQYSEDPTKVNEFIDKQKDYNDIVAQYRNALIEHREDTFELNTAVGARILP